MGAKQESELGTVSLLLILLLLLPSSFWPGWSSPRATLEQGVMLQDVFNTKWITEWFVSWVSGTNPCLTNCEGIACDATRIVITLNLSQSGLNGSVPAALEELSSLRVLDLSNVGSCPPNAMCESLNAVKGDLAALSNLRKLKNLGMSFHELSLNKFATALLKLTNLVDLRLDNTLIKGTKLFQLSLLHSQAFSTCLSLEKNFFSFKCPQEQGKLVNSLVQNLVETLLSPGIVFQPKVEEDSG